MISDAQAREIVLRHYPDARPGSFTGEFLAYGTIPEVPELLIDHLAILDVDDRQDMLVYVTAIGPRAGEWGWERVAAG